VQLLATLVSSRVPDYLRRVTTKLLRWCAATGVTGQVARSGSRDGMLQQRSLCEAVGARLGLFYGFSKIFYWRRFVFVTAIGENILLRSWRKIVGRT
jgi:hypothetical protein